MSTENPKRIELKGCGRHEEGTAGGTIRPGSLIKLGTDGKVVVHSSAGGRAERLFALEDALQGREIDTNYASGEKVQFTVANPGDEIYALLDFGEDAEPGEFLTSNGDGTLKVVGGSDVAVAVALENQDLTDSGEAVAGRIRVRVV